MRKYITLLIALNFSLFSSILFAGGSPDGIEYDISKSKNLKPEPKSPAYHVNFDGLTEIKAKYEFIYKKNSFSKRNPALYIYPTKDSINTLPTFKDRGKPIELSSIYIFNPSKTANKLLSEETAKKLLNGNFPFLSGEAVFVIDGLSASYECDQVLFYSKIKSVKSTTIKEKTEKLQVAKHGC